MVYAGCQTLSATHAIHSTTRLRKLDDPDGPYSAVILAKAGMVRQGLGGRLTADLPAPTLYYAVGQGALCIEIREGDATSAELCAAITHWQTWWACMAERALLRELEGGCSVPVGVNTALEVLRDDAPDARSARLAITGTITSLDGARHVQHELVETLDSAAQGEALGVRLARWLVEHGGAEILDEIKKDRAMRQGENKTAEEVAKIEAVQAPAA